jgi:hypothetical protein
LKLVRANAAFDQSSNQPIPDFGALVVDFIEKAVD